MQSDKRVAYHKFVLTNLQPKTLYYFEIMNQARTYVYERVKTLIVYYSRTGTTKKAAEILAEELKAEIEEIEDTACRRGIIGYLISGRDAVRKKLTVLKPAKYDVSDFDLVVIGTPIWGWNISTPVRTYIAINKGKFKKVAFFCTMRGSGAVKVFLDMESIASKKPVATLALLEKDVKNKIRESRISSFAQKIVF